MGVAKRIRAYAGRDTVMRGLIAKLESDGDELARPMAPAAAKQMYFASSAALRTRDLHGKAIKRPF